MSSSFCEIAYELRHVRTSSGVACPCSSDVNLEMGLSDAGDDWDINLNIEGGAIYFWRSVCTMQRMITLSADNWCYNAPCTQLALKSMGSITYLCR